MKTPPPPIQSPTKSSKTLNSISSEGINNTSANGGSMDENSPLSVSPPLLVEIEPNTPAAEALAANSSIRVSKLHKAARSTRIQASIRVLKSTVRAVGGQPGHAGDRRGDPDFCLPNSGSSNSGVAGSGVGSSGVGGSGVGNVRMERILDESEDESHKDDNEEEDAVDDLEGHASTTPISSAYETSSAMKSISTPLTHAALPEAIAAACLAGEELERRRMRTSMTTVGGLPENVKQQILEDDNDEEEQSKPIEATAASISSSPPETAKAATTTTEPESDKKPKEEESPSTSTTKTSRHLRQFSRRTPLDDHFHFHGPRSVRHWINTKRSHRRPEQLRSYVKGKVINQQHELFIMSIAIMLGMRTSIGRTNAQMAETRGDERRWLDGEDLMSVEKYVFPPRGSEITPPHQLNHTFKFKDYSPHAFAYLRRMFGVNEYEFLLSVCGNANYIEFQSNAKSGQFFFYSKDGKYMIKTMTSAESKFLRRILPHYFRHCALNPNTLITKFLGMYRVKLYHLRRNVKFMVMKSVYDTDKHLHHVYDVKGSSTGRDAKAGEAVKKDNDVRRALPDGAFIFESNLRETLRSQVERDCHWLKAMKIMDYSMLIGVHNIAQSSNSKRSGSTLGKPKPKSMDNGLLTPTTPLSLRKSPSTSQNTGGTDDRQDEFSQSFMTLDPYLDEDDDNSYLEGATHRRSKSIPCDIFPDNISTLPIPAVTSADGSSISDVEKGKKESSEEYVEKAIEDMYWPFHRYYDLQGRRRLTPIKEELIANGNTFDNSHESSEPQHCNKKKQKYFKLFSSSSAPPSSFGSTHYQIPIFEKPLSERKDGGFMMDLTNIELPLQLSVPGAPHMVEYCEGKIFYMGIIDILQQFNIRKRLEARWRRMGGKGWEAASCVHPTIYADRFLRFFDEYTTREEEDDDSVDT